MQSFLYPLKAVFFFYHFLSSLLYSVFFLPVVVMGTVHLWMRHGCKQIHELIIQCDRGSTRSWQTPGVFDETHHAEHMQTFNTNMIRFVLCFSSVTHFLLNFSVNPLGSDALIPVLCVELPDKCLFYTACQCQCRFILFIHAAH